MSTSNRQYLLKIVNRLIHEERGATGVEYGILVAAVAAGIIAAAFSMGVKTKQTFEFTDAALP